MAGWYDFSIESGVLSGDAPDRPPSGGLGLYRITLVLSRPGDQQYVDNFDAALFSTGGDSLLEIPGRSLTVGVQTDYGVVSVNLQANSHRRLARVNLEVEAPSFDDAIVRGHDAVAPLLSWWSFQHDVGLAVGPYQVVEVASGIRRFRAGLLGQIQRLTDHEPSVPTELAPELRPFLAAYREASISTNVYHQVVCLFKAFDGLSQLRVQRRRPGQVRLSFPATTAQIVGVDSDVRATFEPYLGKKFGRAKELLEPLRDKAAHMESGRHFNPDFLGDEAQCLAAIPVLRYMTRETLRQVCLEDEELSSLHIR